MSLEFFEPRPPKSAAIKLDFLDHPDREVAETLRAMPGVDQVAIEYSEDRRTVMIPHGDSPLRLEVGWSDDSWLVCTPPPFDSLTRYVELEIVSDRQFHRRYRPCETADVALQ